MISDLVTVGEIPEDVRRSLDAWAGCIAGALERTEYLNVIKMAGFIEIEIVNQHSYAQADADERISGKIASVQVRAVKPCCKH